MTKATQLQKFALEVRQSAFNNVWINLLKLDPDIHILLNTLYTLLIALVGRGLWCVNPFMCLCPLANSPYWSSKISYSTSGKNLIMCQTFSSIPGATISYLRWSSFILYATKHQHHFSSGVQFLYSLHLSS